MTAPKDKTFENINKSSKRFLKLFQFKNIVNENDYLLYKSTKDVSWPNVRNGDSALDNNCVIFYNPDFFCKYDYRINFEV